MGQWLGAGGWNSAGEKSLLQAQGELGAMNGARGRNLSEAPVAFHVQRVEMIPGRAGARGQGSLSGAPLAFPCKGSSTPGRVGCQGAREFVWGTPCLPVQGVEYSQGWAGAMEAGWGNRN
jgi:hypothetical protein